MHEDHCKQLIERGYYQGERPLFHASDLKIVDTIFDEGESPLKESEHIDLERSMFRWKYPLWYANDITARHCTWFEMARAGVWYTKHMLVEDCAIEAPKNFRRCQDLTIRRTSFPNAQETLWQCSEVKLEDVMARGPYFAMNSQNISVRGLTLYGDYSFDGAKHVEVSDSKLLSKDAFWNSEDVTIYNSFISGEYLGWNSKNLTLVDCTIESLQGLCYIEHLVLKNCRLVNTTLAFEYATVDADVEGPIDSVINPSGGIIRAEEIKTLYLEPDKVDPGKTDYRCRIGQQFDHSFA